MFPSLLRCACAAMWLGWLAATPLAAQGTRPRPSTGSSNPQSLRTLETEAQKAREAYIAQLTDLAKGYEDSGAGDRAQETLQQILKINPDDAAVKAKIKELQDKVYRDRQSVIEVDAGKGWISTGLRVTKGQPIRMQSEGSYKFIVNAEVGSDGFPTENPMQDMGSGVNTGALMGIVLSDAGPRGRAPKPGEVFQIGRELEYKPGEDGVLFVRLNVPPASKCIGKVTLKVAGNIAPVGR